MMPCSVLSSEPMTQSGLPTSVNRSKNSESKSRQSIVDGASPIAADGGFGPMSYDDSEGESVVSDEGDAADTVEVDDDEDFGEDFDNFEAGAEDEDFGDFDEGFQQASIPEEQPDEIEPYTPPVQTLPPSLTPYVSVIKRLTQSGIFMRCIVGILS